MTPSNMTPSAHPTSVHPDPTNPQVLWFRIQPPPALSAHDPQALHDALHDALHEALRLHLRRLGIVSHQAAGFGVAIPIGRELLPADRHELANFVLDAGDSVTVELGDICLAQELIEDCKDRLRHPEPDDTARLDQVGAHMVMNVVRQALRQWRQEIQALQGAQDHQPAKAEPPRAAAPAEVPTEFPTDALGTPTHPRQPAALQALCMAVQLVPELSRRNRGRYWARVRTRLRQHGLVLAQRHGVAMVLAVGRPLGVHDRPLIVRVLLEQPQTWQVTFNEPFDVAWCLSEDFAVRVADDEDACDGTHASESPHDTEEGAAHHAAQLTALRHALRQLLARACIGHARTVEAARQRLREATQR